MQAPSSAGSAAKVAEYLLSPAAERDLEGIWKYTRREWGLEQADRYTDLLTAAFKVLAEAPKSAPACDHFSCPGLAEIGQLRSLGLAMTAGKPTLAA
jgi:plasmid stabilization system protein ParE